MENISCSVLKEALAALAQENSPESRKYANVKTIPRAQNTSYLTDTADAVREVARRMTKTRIRWENPKCVMIITKPGDYSLIGMTRCMVIYLALTPRNGEQDGITVYIDEKLKDSKRFCYEKIIRKYPNIVEKLKFWTPELCAANPKTFDFIITLGGDGTVLFSSWLFQNYIPPVIPFHLGSLGFLTPFDFDRYKFHLHNALERGVRINLRGRITCTVYRRVPHPDCKSPEPSDSKSIQLRNIARDPVTGKLTVGGWCNSQKQFEKKNIRKKKKKFGEVDGEDVEDQEEGDDDQDIRGEGRGQRDWEEKTRGGGDPVFSESLEESFIDERQVPCYTTVPVEKYHVINDLVIDRGPSPYVSLLELFGDEQHLTTVQADGLAISTPTGSTAYSLSAGGSLTHPDIQAILITPICPHTLSFRPTLVPDSMELRICVPFNSRNTAWASFDGRGRVELRQGDHIKVTASRYPFPTVCKEDQATDWFSSLQNSLHWNKRERQKSFAVVESHGSVRPKVGLRKNSTSSQSTSSSISSTTPNRNNSLPAPPRTVSPPYTPKRKSSASSTTTLTSDSTLLGGTDSVFAMFCDEEEYDDSNQIKTRSPRFNDNNNNRHMQQSNDDDTSQASLNYESTDEFESDTDSDDFGLDAFVGWTDDEIMKSRYLATIASELERVSFNKNISATTTATATSANYTSY